MKPFALEPRMLTMRGVFYPTGYLFVMFPSLADAERLDHDLQESGYRDHDVMLLDSQTILGEIGKTAAHTNSPLPSVGTEVATVHEFEERALQGNCAVLVHAPSSKDTEFVMDVVHSLPFTYAQKYRPLVIEDMH